MRSDGQPLSFTEANGIRNILILCCEATGTGTENFMVHAMAGCVEYRFCGGLGFGGKFWNANGRWYVTCYSENETPARLKMINEANRRLAELKAELQPQEKGT